MANVFFAKGDTNTINQIPIREGQILFDTQSYIIYVDTATTRVPYAGSDTSDASGINFNNTGTTLTDDNVQDAIASLDEKIQTSNQQITNVKNIVSGADGQGGLVGTVTEQGDTLDSLSLRFANFASNVLFRNEYRDITADFNSGVFSSNISQYRAGNYIKKTYGGITYVAVLADFNTYYNVNSTRTDVVKVPHWTAIIFGFPAKQINSTNTTNNGYGGSELQTWLNSTGIGNLKNAFGSSHFLSRRTMFTTSASGWGYQADVFLTLMTESQLGYRAWSEAGYSVGDSHRELSIFRNDVVMNVLSRDFGQSNNVFITKHAWLRDVSARNTTTSFCRFASDGVASDGGATSEYGCFPLAVLV